MEGPGGGPSGGFTRAVVEQAEFDASQYGFFGEMQLPNEELGGALEDGLEAPPEEHLIGGFDDDDLPIEQLVGKDHEDEDEDLSLAALFARKAGVNNDAHVIKPPHRQQQHAPADGPAPPPVPSLLASLRSPGHHAAHAGDSPAAGGAASAAPAAPPVSQPFSIGLDLISALPGEGKPLRDAAPAALAPPAVTASQNHHWQLTSQQAQQQLPGVSGAAAGAEALMPQPAATAAPRHPPPGFGPQPMAQGGMVAGAMTAEQLEAQMISKAREQQQQQQQHAPAAGGDKGLLALLKGGAAAGPGAGAGPIAAPSPQQMQQRPPFGMPLPPGGPPTGPPTGPPVSQAQPMQQPPPPSFPQQPPPPWAAPGGMPHPPPHMASMPPNGGFPPGGIRPPHLDVQGRMQPHGVPGGMPGFPYPPPPHLRGPYGLGPMPGTRPIMVGPHGPMPPNMPMPPGGPGQLPAGFNLPPGFPLPPQHMQQLPGMAGGAPPLPQPLQQQMQAPGFVAQQQQQQQQTPPRQRPASAPGPGATFGQGFAPGHPQHGQQQQGQQQGQQGGQQQGHQHAYGGFGSYGSTRRQLYEGQLMSTDEIEHVLRIQFAATHTGDPYVEDYYAQAYRHKYLGGRNAATFAPDALRRDGGATGLALREARHAQLEGLGRFVLSNIRTPKRLMDVGAGARDARGGGGEDAGKRPGTPGGSSARLEDEPMLAARILIEDCYSNLLRVEDLDRAAAADEAAGMTLDPASEAGVALRRERGALLRGIVTSLQLADELVGGAGGSGGLGDWVFLRVMQLPKGRLMLAKALKFMCHPVTGRAVQQQQQSRGARAAPPRRQQRPWHELVDGAGAGGEDAAAAGEDGGMGSEAAAVWAVLRNARELFGPAVPAGGARGEGEKRMLTATEALAVATAEALRQYTAPADMAAAAAALVAGVASSSYPLLPLYPAGRAAPGSQPAWLGSVLSVLLLRAGELGLGTNAGQEEARLGDGGEEEGPQEPAPAVDAAAAAAWLDAYAALQLAVAQHLVALHQAKQATGGGEEAAAAAAASGLPAATLEQLRAHAAELACVPLVRAMVQDHAQGEDKERLRVLLTEVMRS